MTAGLTERITVRFTPERMQRLHVLAMQRSTDDAVVLPSDIVRWAVDQFVDSAITEPLFSDPIGVTNEP